MADIDNLSIQISAKTGAAIKNIDRLTAALANLNAQLNALDPSRLQRVTSAASGIGNIASSLSNAGRSVQTFANGLSNVSQQGGGLRQTQNQAEGMAQSLTQVGRDAGNAVRSLREVGQQGTSSLNQVASAARNVSRHTTNSAANIRSLSRETKSAAKHAKIFGKELTRVGKMLKLMITRMILRKIISGVLDGFKNLAQYSSTFDATLSLLWNDFKQLGNSIAAAVAPMLNALAPALHTIIQLVTKTINVINQLISALFGLKSWTRAKVLTDSYAKSLDNANKSAKALRKTVLGFDELNQLQDNKDNGGDSGTSPKDMFEEMPIDPRILKFLDDIKEKIGSLKPLWDAFAKGFAKGLGDDWKDKVKQIVDGALRIHKALADIWNDNDVKKARDDYFISLARMLGTIAGTVVRIGLNIGVNLAQGLARSLEEKAPEIKKYLVEMFDIGTEINDQILEFSLAIGEISDVLAGENAINATKGFSNIFLESFMLITENAARLGKSIVKLVTQPIIDNKELISKTLDEMFGILADFTDAIQKIIADMRKTVSDVWKQHFSPMFDNLTKGISKLMAFCLQAWNTYLAPLLKRIVDTIKPFWDAYLKPIFDDIMHIIGLIGNLASMVFNSVLVPMFGAMIDDYMPKIQGLLTVLISLIEIIFKTASTVIQHITWELRTLLQFFETGFTVGWDEACAELDKSWSEHWDSMFGKVKDVVGDILNVIEDMINAIVHGVNGVLDKLGNIKDIKLPEFVGGGSFSFSSLKKLKLNEVHFSGAFAGGGMVENGLFLANSSELVGRFNNGKTAVANNEQIIQGISAGVYSAVSSALASSNSGNGQYISNTIVVDGEVIARTVTKAQQRQNARYSPVTG